MVWGVEYFRPYFWGRPFTVKTDHKPLLWSHKLKENSIRIARWKERLAPYEIKFVYMREKENAVEDMLSRHVCALDLEGNPSSVTENSSEYGFLESRRSEDCSRHRDMERVQTMINKLKLNQIIVDMKSGAEVDPRKITSWKRRILSVNIRKEADDDTIVSLFTQVRYVSRT